MAEAKTVATQKFPYYIVRFKLGITLSRQVAEGEFPYYIVRFKQRHERLALQKMAEVSILHSTI